MPQSNHKVSLTKECVRILSSKRGAANRTTIRSKRKKRKRQLSPSVKKTRKGEDKRPSPKL